MCSIEEELEAVSQTEDLEYIDETGDYSYVVEIVKGQVKVRISIPESYPETTPVFEIVPQEMKEVSDSMQRMLLRLAADCCKSAADKRMIQTVMKNWGGFFKIAEQKCVKSSNEVASPVATNKKLSKKERQIQNRKAKLAARFQHSPSPIGKQNKKKIHQGEQEVGTKSEIIKAYVNETAPEQTEQKKKPSMKTAKDVIDRILWDKQLEASDFRLGYLDRFDGIIENAFLELNWKDDIASTGPSDPLKIPEHRIEYFKWKTEIVWDKHHRIDHVFGSSGSEKDIRTFIDEFQKSQKEAAVESSLAEAQSYSDAAGYSTQAGVADESANVFSNETKPSVAEQDSGDAADKVLSEMKSLEISEPENPPEKSWAEQMASAYQQEEVVEGVFNMPDGSDADKEDEDSDGRQAGNGKRSRDHRKGASRSSWHSGKQRPDYHHHRQYHEDSGSNSHRDPKRQRRDDWRKEPSKAPSDPNYCIAMDLSDELLDVCYRLQGHLLHEHPNAEGIEPFVTAITFYLQDSRGRDVVGKELSRISGSWSAFPLELQGLYYHDNCISVKIKESKDLQDFSDRLERNLCHKYGFRSQPHVKLVTNIGSDHGHVDLHRYPVSGTQLIYSACIATMMGEVIGRYCRFRQEVVKDRDWEFQVSKCLSAILRHNAMGLKVGDDGFISVNTILAQNYFSRKMQVTEEDIVTIVETNNKKRFYIEGEKGAMRIRANQGHTVKVHSLQMETIQNPADYPTVVHGTTMKFWGLIHREGLSRMKRNHIHMTTAEPRSREQVISGMRSTSDCFIYVDIAKAMADGITFVVSENGVILSEGIGGIIEPKYFKEVYGMRNGRRCLLMQDGQLLYKDDSYTPPGMSQAGTEITDPNKHPDLCTEIGMKQWEHVKLKGLRKKKDLRWTLGPPKQGHGKHHLKGGTCIIHIDVAKAMKDGIKFFEAGSGEVWTEGRDGGIKPEYFKEAYFFSKNGRHPLLERPAAEDGKRDDTEKQGSHKEEAACSETTE